MFFMISPNHLNWNNLFSDTPGKNSIIKAPKLLGIFNLHVGEQDQTQSILDCFPLANGLASNTCNHTFSHVFETMVALHMIKK